MEKETIEHPTTKAKATFWTGCKMCDDARAYFMERGSTPFQPSHEPGYSCRSGKRPHCTCDSCF